VSDVRARVLILGSLPGRRSIADAEYYAQPRNAFWHILGELAGAGPDLDYPHRLERMKAAGIALWDVLAAGERPGSLDSAIVRSSIVINDIGDFLATHRDITTDLLQRSYSCPAVRPSRVPGAGTRSSADHARGDCRPPVRPMHPCRTP
jgi:double-stranded uracil-DNA glycosylase